MAIAVESAANGDPCFWGAPTYDQVRIGWNEARHACRGNADFKQGTMTATFPTGGNIIYRSLDDPDNARGHSFKKGFLDEAGDIKQVAYYEVILPILADSEDSELWSIGSPRGRNWFWREVIGALSRDDSMSWQIPTKGCEIVDGNLVRKPHPLENPDFPWSEIERMFLSMSHSTFRQEVMAEFLEGEGSVFRNIRACMNARLDVKPHEHKFHESDCEDNKNCECKDHEIYAGVDLAIQKDFTAVSIGCRDCHEEIARARFNKIPYSLQRKRMKALFEKWNVKTALVETNSNIANFEDMQREGMPVKGFATTASTKSPLIESLALALEKVEWQFQKDDIWLGELEAYERKVQATTGRSSYSAPEGLHDDTVIARALMLRAAERNELGVIDNPFYD